MNKADKARLGAFERIGCMACRQLGYYAVPEVHHLKSGNRRRGHQFTVPLCPAHHRGANHDPEMHGPSLALSPRSFHAAFGTDEELLAKTNELLP